jgi:MarR-like DNA-binding transcriptional regulator SgrR of sgrS sRNA
MKRSGLLLLVAVSVASISPASTRPHYGGTLRLAMRDAPMSLDPADSSRADRLWGRNLSRLVFETLVNLDGRGQPQPSLSSSWHVDPGNQRWQFIIRRGVTFHDGTAVSADTVAASLRAANPKWKVFASGDAVVIECDVPTPNLPAVLALPRYAIAKRAGGKLAGSGPFSISSWEPGKKLILSARDDYWGGRVFVDTIEVAMGQSFREQMIALDLGLADVVEVAPDQARRATLEGRRIESSSPAELMALVFSQDSQSAQEGKWRAALALSIDRATINRALLQEGGEPSGTCLPGWLTGYAFLFPTAVDVQRARQLRGEARVGPAWAVASDASDPLSRVIAGRIGLNALDAGLVLLEPFSLPTKSTVAEIRLVRIPLASLDARVALTDLAARIGLPQPKFNSESADDLYDAENALLQSQRVIPLLHLRTVAAISPRVQDWTEERDGEWRLENVWLGVGMEMEKP